MKCSCVNIHAVRNEKDSAIILLRTRGVGGCWRGGRVKTLTQICCKTAAALYGWCCAGARVARQRASLFSCMVSLCTRDLSLHLSGKHERHLL